MPAVYLLPNAPFTPFYLNGSNCIRSMFDKYHPLYKRECVKKKRMLNVAYDK